MPELMQLIEDWKGYVALSEVKKSEGYEQKLKETIDLLSNANNLPPHRHEYLLREALTTSDFPLLFGDVLDRQVLASYKAGDSVFRNFCRISTVPDFRQVSRFAITGGDEDLAKVGEKGEYLASDRNEGRYYYQVYKYGRQFDISWETIINDDLNALQDTPERFARAALRTEQRFAASLYVHNATLATGGQGNITTALLTIANLETALEWFGEQTDAGGRPIYNRAKYLVVPPALEMTARQILTSATKMWLEGAAGTMPAGPTNYPMTNVLPQMGLQLIIDPWITVLDVAAGQPLSARRGWYLFSDPKEVAAVEVGFLRGHERPEICMKASDKVTIGGGLISPMTGDFATDNIFYRVRHVLGGCTLDYRGFYFGGHAD